MAKVSARKHRNRNAASVRIYPIVSYYKPAIDKFRCLDSVRIYILKMKVILVLLLIVAVASATLNNVRHTQGNQVWKIGTI